MCTYNSTDLEIVPSDNPILCSPVILEIDKPPSEAWKIRKTKIHQFNPECVQGIYRRYNDRDQKQILNLHKVDKITNKAKSNLCWNLPLKGLILHHLSWVESYCVLLVCVWTPLLPFSLRKKWYMQSHHHKWLATPLVSTFVIKVSIVRKIKPFILNSTAGTSWDCCSLAFLDLQSSNGHW